MKARPILLSSAMVRALIDGRKTQTRRVMKPQPPDWIREFGYTFFTPRGSISGRGNFEDKGPAEKFFRCPYGVRGDLLYVKEAWRASSEHDDLPPSNIPAGDSVAYLADGEPKVLAGRYRHARFMPRRYSRLTLKITDVRIQRLNEISEQDAIAEGVETWRAGWTEKDAAKALLNATRARVETNDGTLGRRLYMLLWESINGPQSWSENPFVWVVEFETIKRNVDEVMREAT